MNSILFLLLLCSSLAAFAFSPKIVSRDQSKLNNQAIKAVQERLESLNCEGMKTVPFLIAAKIYQRSILPSCESLQRMKEKHRSN